MNGVLVVDKAVGPTSHDVVRALRRVARERRVGHAGTLDPLASGVLVLCCGEATKLVPYLMDADKEYQATLRLGVATDTDDADPRGRVLHQAAPAALAALGEARVREVLGSFVGQVPQRPPRFSALRVEGQRMHDLARRAADEEQDQALAAAQEDKQRLVRIDEVRVDAVRLGGAEPEVDFFVRCGKGTYIRSIARDAGERLGVGGHLRALRRLRVGRFSLAEASLGWDAGAPLQLFDALAALGHLPRLLLSDDEAQQVRCGHVAALQELLPRAAARLGADAEGALVALRERDQALVAVLLLEQGRLRVGRGFAG